MDPGPNAGADYQIGITDPLVYGKIDQKFNNVLEMAVPISVKISKIVISSEGAIIDGELSPDYMKALYFY